MRSTTGGARTRFGSSRVIAASYAKMVATASPRVNRFSKRSKHRSNAPARDPVTSQGTAEDVCVCASAARAKIAEPGNHASTSFFSQKCSTHLSIFALSSAGIRSSNPAAFRALARALTAVRNNPAPILSSPSAIASSTTSSADVSAATTCGLARPAPCRARTLCDESIDIAACGVSTALPSWGSFASQTSSMDPSGFEPPTSASSTRRLTSPTLMASTARVNLPTFRPNVSIQIATPRIALARSSADMSSPAVRATASTNAASDARIDVWAPRAAEVMN